MTHDLTCSECREHLPWHVGGRLPESVRSAVARHLAACDACRKEAALWEAVSATLAEEERRVPADMQAEAGWRALRESLPVRSSWRQSDGVLRLTGEAPEGRGRVTSRPVSPQPSRESSRRPALALAAAILLIGLSAALFGVLGVQLRHGNAPAAAATSTATPAACPPGTLTASVPANARIADISMTSPRDGWAVGWIEDDAQQGTAAPTPPASLLLHFQNCHWQPSSGGLAATELYSISMISAGNGWAVGATVTDFSILQSNGVTTHQWVPDKLIVLRYAAGQWQRTNVPGVTSGLGAKVRMTAAGDGWMLVDGGKTHTDPYTAKYAYTLLHYQGGAWTPVPLRFDASGTLELWDVAATIPDDCWIVGYGTAAGDDFAVSHYHAGAWTTWSGKQLGVTYPDLYSIAMTSPSDVWVAGSYPYKNAGGDNIGPLVLHYDGATWTRENVGNYQDTSTNDHGIMSIAAVSAKDIWAFPALFEFSGGQYHMAHDASGVWTWGVMPARILSIVSTSFVSAAEGFAVASTPSRTGSTTVLLHYLNGTWSVIPSP